MASGRNLHASIEPRIFLDRPGINIEDLSDLCGGEGFAVFIANSGEKYVKIALPHGSVFAGGGVGRPPRC